MEGWSSQCVPSCEVQVLVCTNFRTSLSQPIVNSMLQGKHLNGSDCTRNLRAFAQYSLGENYCCHL